MSSECIALQRVNGSYAGAADASKFLPDEFSSNLSLESFEKDAAPQSYGLWLNLGVQTDINLS